MAGFADLVPRQNPCLAAVATRRTEGKTWRWQFDDVLDDSGAPIDLTTATGTSRVVAQPGGEVIATLTFTGAPGSFTLELDESGTVGLAGGLETRRCRWFLTVALAGDVVEFWGSVDSPFNINRGD